MTPEELTEIAKELTDFLCDKELTVIDSVTILNVVKEAIIGVVFDTAQKPKTIISGFEEILKKYNVTTECLMPVKKDNINGLNKKWFQDNNDEQI